MAKNTNTKNTTKEAGRNNPASTDIKAEVAVEKEEAVVETVALKKETGTRTVKPVVELNDDENFEVYANVPNLSYYDKTTGMTLNWENIGDMMYMTFAELKVMHRTAPNYMNKLLVSFNDSRLDEYFRIAQARELYNKLFDMDLNNRDNIAEWKKIYDELGRVNASVKPIILTRLQSMVANNELTNINCIKDFEGVFRVSGILY